MPSDDSVKFTVTGSGDGERERRSDAAKRLRALADEARAVMAEQPNADEALTRARTAAKSIGPALAKGFERVTLDLEATGKMWRRRRAVNRISEALLETVDEAAIDAVRELAEINEVLRNAGYDVLGLRGVNVVIRQLTDTSLKLEELREEVVRLRDAGPANPV